MSSICPCVEVAPCSGAWQWEGPAAWPELWGYPGKQTSQCCGQAPELLRLSPEFEIPEQRLMRSVHLPKLCSTNFWLCADRYAGCAKGRFCSILDVFWPTSALLRYVGYKFGRKQRLEIQLSPIDLMVYLKV